MPVIKSAIKKLRADKKRTAHNNVLRASLEQAIKKAKKETRDFKVIMAAQSAIDKAVKNNLLHENKAARLKAKLSKNAKPAKTTPVAKSPKKSAVKTPKKK